MNTHTRFMSTGTQPYCMFQAPLWLALLLNWLSVCISLHRPVAAGGARPCPHNRLDRSAPTPALREKLCTAKTSMQIVCIIMYGLYNMMETTKGSLNKEFQEAEAKGTRCTTLVAQPLEPPYCAIDYCYTSSPFIFRYRKASRYTPANSPYRSQSLCKGGERKEVSQLKLPSGVYRAIGGIAAIVLPIAV